MGVNFSRYHVNSLELALQVKRICFFLSPRFSETKKKKTLRYGEHASCSQNRVTLLIF